MTEKDVMFRVLYNPKTKEVYTNPEGNVYDFDFLSELETATKNYPDIKKAMDNGYIVKEVTEYGIEDSLNYTETFCYCDSCGKLFLQDDLSFSDEGAPYCSKCYERYETYDVYFQCLGLDIVSRGDYEGMSLPMYAGEFDDAEMQIIADTIYSTLVCDYGYGVDAEEYFRNPNHLREVNNTLYEDIDDAFWREMENIAIEMGMRYYEDMTDEEYQKICKKNI